MRRAGGSGSSPALHREQVARDNLMWAARVWSSFVPRDVVADGTVVGAGLWSWVIRPARAGVSSAGVEVATNETLAHLRGDSTRPPEPGCPEDDAERRGRHSHAERGNEFASAVGVSRKTTRSVADGIPPRGSEGTSSFVATGGVSRRTTRGVGDVMLVRSVRTRARESERASDGAIARRPPGRALRNFSQLCLRKVSQRRGRFRAVSLEWIHLGRV
jgi:hypothetical protein